MSDDFLVIVPCDPTLVPSPEISEHVVAVLRRLAPQAESVTAEAADSIQFYDCGENFEGLSCPKCLEPLDLDWWHERMGLDEAGGAFALRPFATPCCGASLTLNDLAYDWPQAFGRFRWEVQNPNIGNLSRDAEARIAETAGFPVRFVRQHV